MAKKERAIPPEDAREIESLEREIRELTISFDLARKVEERAMMMRTRVHNLRHHAEAKLSGLREKYGVKFVIGKKEARNGR